RSYQQLLLGTSLYYRAKCDPPGHQPHAPHISIASAASHRRSSQTLNRRPRLPPDPRSSSPPGPASQHRTMGNAISASVSALCVAMSAVDLVRLPNPQPGGGTTAAAAQAPAALRSTVLPLAAVGGLFTSVALICRHVHDAGAGNQRRLVTVLLCASAGFLDFFLFVAQAQAGGSGGVDPAGAAACELGLAPAALRALPAAAAVTFCLGMLLIIIRHIRAGGEGGGGAVAGNGQAPVVGLLAKMVMGAAAGLVCLMAIALYGA
ncbi:unnamed protein product, partial [Urochloa humidicola]